MGLKNNKWKLGKYNSDQVDLLNEHVRPLLAHSSYYDRSVAYLKSSHLNDISLELLDFVEKGGKARYLIGDPLEYSTFIAIHHALANGENPSYISELKTKLVEFMRDASLQLEEDFPNVVLQYLVATRKLIIKIIIRAGLHHEKIRIGRDSNGNTVVCCGSDNDSTSALTGPNRESGILVYSWAYPGTDYWESHGEPSVIDFEKDWNNESEDSYTLELDDETLQVICKDWEKRNISSDALYKKIKEHKYKNAVDERGLRDYQEDAIESWQESNYKGIMALCTGAGKTFTAITAARKLSEYWNREGQSFVIVVAVPYKILAHQWLKELSIFFHDPVGCWSDFPNWNDIFDAQFYTRFGISPMIGTMVVVVVNDTLLGNDFKQRLKKIPTEQLMWIGDEVHQHAHEKYQSVIPEADYILGLSATPWSIGQFNKARILNKTYGPIVSEFGIKEALRKEVLVPYYYKLAVVNLSEKESEEFKRITEKLAPYLTKDIMSLSSKEKNELNNLIRNRNAVIGSCQEKMDWVNNFARENRLHHSLIYCAEGNVPLFICEDRIRALEHVARIFDRNNWSISKITAEETKEQREVILNALSQNEIDAILAIRVLDEGFDLPLCKNAVILSSSKNERQFIQRRGRVLRNHPSKKFATIFDFFVLPHHSFSEENWAKILMNSEAIRAWEFGRFSLTMLEINNILDSIFINDMEQLVEIKKSVENRTYDDELEIFIGDINE